MKHLVSIDAFMSSSVDLANDELWNQDRFNQLGCVHPKLRKFFLMGRANYAWVLREDSGVWEKCSIPRLSFWDILTGVYDGI